MTRIDALTQVHNRSFLDKRLAEELERSRRFGNPLSIILIDIDHFKKINDTYGHLCGDHSLRRVAAILKRVARMSMWSGDTVVKNFAASYRKYLRLALIYWQNVSGCK